MAVGGSDLILVRGAISYSGKILDWSARSESAESYKSRVGIPREERGEGECREECDECGSLHV